MMIKIVIEMDIIFHQMNLIHNAVNAETEILRRRKTSNKFLFVSDICVFLY